VCTVVASSTAVSDPTGARRLGHASIGLSVAGIIVTVVVVIIVVALVVSAAAAAVSCPYTVYGNCYTYRTPYHSSSYYCSGVTSGGYCYSN